MTREVGGNGAFHTIYDCLPERLAAGLTERWHRGVGRMRAGGAVPQLGWLHVLGDEHVEKVPGAPPAPVR